MNLIPALALGLSCVLGSLMVACPRQLDGGSCHPLLRLYLQAELKGKSIGVLMPPPFSEQQLQQVNSFVLNGAQQ